MYLFNVSEASESIPGMNYPMNVRHKAVTEGVARSQIKSFKHDDYVRMYNGGTLTNVVNCRIGSKLPWCARLFLFTYAWPHTWLCFQVYSMEQDKRELYRYDDKRYLLADLPDGRLNPNT